MRRATHRTRIAAPGGPFHAVRRCRGLGGGFGREGGDAEQGGQSGHRVGLSGRELGSAGLQTEMAARDAASGGRRLHAPPASPIQDSAIFVVKSGESRFRFKDSAILKSRRLRGGAFEGMSEPLAAARHPPPHGAAVLPAQAVQGQPVMTGNSTASGAPPAGSAGVCTGTAARQRSETALLQGACRCARHPGTPDLMD